MKTCCRQGLTLVSVLYFLPVLCAGTIPEWGEVTGDRVNLRARPELHSEVVGQVHKDTRLQVLSIVEDWVEIVPPPEVPLWVYAEFVTDNKVNVSRLNVRSGPGINFNVVGRLERDDEVDVRETVGEWTAIAPPPGSALFIHRDYVRFPPPASPDPSPVALEQPLLPPRPLPPVPDKPSPAPVQELQTVEPHTPPEPRTMPPRPGIPSGWQLAAGERQAVWSRQQGVLRRSAFHLRRPARYRLVRTIEGRTRTLCYVHGEDEVLRRHLGNEIDLEGRLYWTEGVNYPVLAVERVAPRSP